MENMKKEFLAEGLAVTRWQQIVYYVWRMKVRTMRGECGLQLEHSKLRLHSAGQWPGALKLFCKHYFTHLLSVVWNFTYDGQNESIVNFLSIRTLHLSNVYGCVHIYTSLQLFIWFPTPPIRLDPLSRG
jgi:hypothetical protein